MPLVLVKIRIDGKASATTRALVDTGSTMNLVSFSMIQKMGYEESDMRNRPRVEFEGLGGAKSDSYEWTGDIEIFGQSLVPPNLVLERAKIYSTSAQLPWDVLLGQHDALERLLLFHGNRAADPYLELKRQA